MLFCFLNYESEVGPDGTKSGWIPSDPKSLMKKIPDGDSKVTKIQKLPTSKS